MPQVSIIVLTYNPDPAKLRATLSAAVAQRGVEVEIIISDDGSAQKDFRFLPEFFAEHHFSNWRLVENPVNRGTVHNCYAGVSAASGAFVFLTSPGDILFSDTTMQQFYDFAKARNAQLCFGNAVRYCAENGKVRRTNNHSIPAVPDVYGEGASLKNQKTAFFGDTFIIGACYFRSRDFAAKYFEKLLDVCKFMEDTPSTMLALADGIPICYCDRNIVFYEDGTGVSTGAKEKWRKILHADLCSALTLLQSLHPKDPWVQIALKNAEENSRKKRILWRFLHHPVISFRMLLQKKLVKPKQIPCDPADLQRLENLLNQTQA